jgi:hypothetical protein
VERGSSSDLAITDAGTGPRWEHRNERMRIVASAAGTFSEFNPTTSVSLVWYHRHTKA